jgi:hypothetical protein
MRKISLQQLANQLGKNKNLAKLTFPHGISMSLPNFT